MHDNKQGKLIFIIMKRLTHAYILKLKQNSELLPKKIWTSYQNDSCMMAPFLNILVLILNIKKTLTLFPQVSYQALQMDKF